MWEWVVTYWVQVFFGLIATGCGLLAKKFWNLYQSEKQRDRDQDFDKCREEIQNRVRVVEKLVSEREDLLMEKIDRVDDNAEKHDKEIKTDLELMVQSLDALKAGLLPIEGAYLLERCNHLLDKDTITEEEFKHLTQDHAAYKGLGGNSMGDQMFEIVVEKYKQQRLRK